MTFNRLCVAATALLALSTHAEIGTIQKITSNIGFFDALGQNLLVLVKISSPHCGPCRQYAPIFEKAAAMHPNIAFFEIVIDAPATRELAKILGVSSIPTTLFFVRGTRVLSKIGAQSPYQLEKAIKEAFPELF